MDTPRTVVAQLENGRSLPSTRTLKRFAAVTGSRLAISFVPAPKRKHRRARRPHDTTQRKHLGVDDAFENLLCWPFLNRNG
jgi:hypothetical protein